MIQTEKNLPQAIRCIWVACPASACSVLEVCACVLTLQPGGTKDLEGRHVYVK